MIGGVGLGLIEEAFPNRIIRVKNDPSSPWLEVDVEPAWGQEATPANAERKFAVWEATQRIFRVGADGAVEDEHVDPYNTIEALREVPS